jgi:hypothetical protein
MPFFGKKNYDYVALYGTLQFPQPIHPSWESALHSCASLAGGVTGAAKSSLRQAGKTDLNFEEEFSVHLECAVFALHAMDRIAFEHGGVEFRDAILRFIEPQIMVFMIDIFLLPKSTKSEEEAQDIPRELIDLTRGEGGLYDIYNHYYETVEIIGDKPYPGETLYWVLLQRISSLISVNLSGPMASMALWSGVLKALAESGCHDMDTTVEIITEAP